MRPRPAPARPLAPPSSPFAARALASTLALVAALALQATACGGEPDEDALQKWATTETGFQKIAALVRDNDKKPETRVRALAIVVEKNQELRVRGMIEQIQPLDTRKAIVTALVEQLVTHVENRTLSQLAAKDAMLMLLRYLPPPLVDRVQRAVAGWAFADITWETPAEELKSKLESRISAGQIADLGPYGLDAAAILLANGFIAEPMVRYLSGSPAPAAKPLLIKAFRRFFPAFLNVNPFYLDAIRKTQDPAGAQLLFELYQDQKLEQKSRDAAFSVGAMMLDAPTIKGQIDAARPVLAELAKIGSAGAIDDRWLAAANMLVITGGQGLGDVLALFKDDKAYGDPVATGNSIIDLCFALHGDGNPDASAPAIAHALAKGNRVQKAIAIVCAKTLALDAAKPALTQLATANAKVDRSESVADLLGKGADAAGKEVPMTLAFLAKNALEGMALLAASNLPGLDPDKRKARHFVIVVELKELGEPYAAHVEERYQASIAAPPPK